MKPRSRFAGTSFKKATLVVVLLGASVGVTQKAGAKQDKPLEWSWLATSEISKSVLRNDALSDTEKVIALTRHLDDRVTLAPLTPLDILNTTDWEKKKMQPGNDYAWLIDTMGRRDGKARPQAVMEALVRLDTLPGIKNKQEVRSLLYVALALAGGDAPESELLRLLNDPTTPNQVVYRILGGMLGSDRPRVEGGPWLVKVIDRPPSVPLHALPRLLQLADHPWSYLGGSDVIADDKPRNRIYPIRELAYACLLQLGVEAEKVTVSATGKNEDGDPQNFVTTIIVDRASVDEKLRELESQESSIEVEEQSPTKSK